MLLPQPPKRRHRRCMSVCQVASVTLDGKPHSSSVISFQQSNWVLEVLSCFGKCLAPSNGCPWRLPSAPLRGQPLLHLFARDLRLSYIAEEVSSLSFVFLSSCSQPWAPGTPESCDTDGDPLPGSHIQDTPVPLLTSQTPSPSCSVGWGSSGWFVWNILSGHGKLEPGRGRGGC